MAIEKKALSTIQWDSSTSVAVHSIHFAFLPASLTLTLLDIYRWNQLDCCGWKKIESVWMAIKKRRSGV